MLYKRFGKTEEQVSILGFGAMRLPLVEPTDPTSIEEKQATEMIHYAVDQGVNYFDTAFPYHGNAGAAGASEPFLAKALHGVRDKVFVASKLPSWNIHEPKHLDEHLDMQLERLQCETIDFYLLHALNEEHWERLLSCNILEWMTKIKKQGKIKHIGFSFHAALHTFLKITNAFDWEFCQIQYNFLDEKYQAGREGVQYAKSKDMGVVVMEPLRGGQLVNNVPHRVIDLYAQNETQRTPAEWALHWLWNQPEADVVLSGMSTLEQVQQNSEYANATELKKFSALDEKTIGQVVDIYKEKLQINCTGCRYCMPCPHGVDIPSNFAVLNNGYLTDNHEAAKITYKMGVPDYNKAAACIECGDCLELCPQNLQIPDLMKRVVEELG